MTAAQLVHILQITDSFFPVGAFAYSDGLESAAASGLVRDGKGLAGWLNHYLDAVFEPCEGLALLQSMRAARREDWTEVEAIDRELTALKPSAAVRASSRSVGKRLLATYSGRRKGAGASSVCVERASGLPEGNAAVVYGLVFADRGVEERDALLAYGYARLTGMISAALRLISFGQQEGQALLSEALDRLCEKTERVVRSEAVRLRSFGPMLDIQQMNHRYVYSRLFRS
ncbi:MAG TPA: urease accessory UreF family protein [Terriglobia bacterium]|nr:urease accessory UreF family protein [Terriglobia bacterium]